MEGSTGVTAIDAKAAATTSTLASAKRAVPGSVARMAMGPPRSTGVTRPLVAASLLTVAMAPSAEVQVTVPVRSCVVLSVKVPVQVICWEVPSGKSETAGVTCNETSSAGVTSRVVDPSTWVVGSTALTSACPTPVPSARPLLASALLKVATASCEENQVTSWVMSRVVVSEKVPVAVNCWLRPLAMEEAAGVTSIETSAAGLTVRTVSPATLVVGSVAVMVVWPTATGVAWPGLAGSLLTVAVWGEEEAQVTCAVKS